MDTTMSSVSVTLAAHGHPEGTWRSPGYRSAATRAKWAKGFFIAVGLASGFEALVAAQGISLMSDALQGQVTLGQYQSFVDTANGADGFFVLCAVGLAVAFLAWLSRTVEIVPALGAGTPHDSPRWAIGWWFVPIAFLWKPYTVVREAWDRLATTTRSADARLVLAWWLAWIGSTVVARYVGVSEQNVASFEGAQGLFTALLVAEVVSVAAAVLGFLVVREIQARADERALALGFDAPLRTAETQPAIQSPVAGSPSVPTDTLAAAAEPITFCPACGTRRLNGAGHCVSCGADLSAWTPSS